MKINGTELHEIPASEFHAYAMTKKATITIQSRKTGDHFTYKIYASKSKAGRNPVYFVSVLTGQNNEKDYTWIGTIFPKSNSSGIFHHAKTSAIQASAPSVISFAWAWRSNSQNITTHARVFHHGRCANCNRVITHPESLTSGYGPECIKKVAKYRRNLVLIAA